MDLSRNRHIVQNLKVTIIAYKDDEKRYIGTSFFDGQEITVIIPESIVPKNQLFHPAALAIEDEVLVQAEWAGDDKIWIAESIIE